MRFWGAVLVSTAALCSPIGPAVAQSATVELFILEESQTSHWCAYRSEAAWHEAVQKEGAVTVGTLRYLDGRLLQIDVTETDETGDWIVYDSYFLDNQAQIVKLLRLVNVLPGDRSISQIFAFKDGRARKTATSEKQLSTGARLRSPSKEWVPSLPIRIGIKSFPFHRLFELPGLTARVKVCTP